MRDIYDTYLVLKGMDEEAFVNNAVYYGILRDYLPGNTVDYFVDNIEEIDMWADDGHNNWRDQFTAEELYIRAHEYARKALVTW